MIIRISKKRKYKLLFSIILICGVMSCAPVKTDSETYKSSAELNDRGEVTKYKGTAIIAEIIRNTSNEKSRTGTASVKLDSIHKYGFKTKVINLNKGEFVRVSIWQHNSYEQGSFSCVVKCGESKKVMKSASFAITGQNWIKRTHEIYVEADNTTLDFYVFTGGNTAYFDDLTIQKYSSVPVDTTASDLRQLHLVISEKSEKKLEKYKAEALRNGVIGENEKQWVSASIIVNEETFEVEMRLKGDWTDHLNSGKDSYRIKLKGEELFMGMHSFSIQHPKTRNYMHAFWMHQLLEKEKLLTTKYDFIPVSVNGINKGVFAIEAHFEKELLTRMNRPQGPILKMDESGLWEHTLRKKIDPNLQKYPAFEASVILPFKKNKTLKNKQSKIDFIAGAKLVNLYKSLYEKPTEIFEIDQIAKYYALLELGNVQHGHQWHNKRFYYNPKSKKIENIGFDLNAGSQANETLYIIMKLQSNKGPMQWQLILPLLKNTDFKNCYLKYLTQFSEKQYLESSFNNLQTELKEKEQLLGLEIENYSFDKEYYFARAEKIRKQLTIIDSIWTVFIGNDNAINGFVKLHEYQFETDSILLKDISINTYVDQIAKNEYSVVFENYHLNEVEIIGYETVKGQVVYFDMEIIMPSYFKGAKIETRILKNQPKKIYFRSQNTGNKVFKKEVYNWSNPNG